MVEHDDRARPDGLRAHEPVGAEQTVLLTVGEQDDDVVPRGRTGLDGTSDLEDRADADPVVARAGEPRTVS